MKQLHAYMRSVFFFISALFFSNIVCSQSTSLKYPSNKFFVSINSAYLQSAMVYKSDSLQGLNTVRKPSITFTIEGGYNLSKYLDLSLGLGLIKSKSQVNLDKYKKWYNATDAEGDHYQRLTTGSNISEEQNTVYLGIPLSLSVKVPVNEKFEFYLKPGINLLIPVVKSYSSSGRFSYSGYYPQYDVFISDIVYEDFLANQDITVQNKVELNSLVPSATASSGLSFTVNNFKISMGVTYLKTLKGIGLKGSAQDFILTSKPGQLRSLIDGSSNVTTSWSGVMISITYFLK